MGIRVFGAPPNRTHRVLWMLEEGGLEYELVRLHSADEIAGSDELARHNPNRKVPTIVDGDVVVWDSLAINLYLAERYDLLLPQAKAGFAHAVQWSFFAQTELDGHLLAMAKARFGSEAERDDELVRRAGEALAGPLAVLERFLDGREHLLGPAFSVADLNVSAVLAVAGPVGVELGPYPRLGAWLGRCFGRPAARDVFARALEG